MKGRPKKLVGRCDCDNETTYKNSKREWVCEECRRIERINQRMFSELNSADCHLEGKKKRGRPAKNLPVETFKLCRD